MYATHATLVDHESYTFMKRGIDVYTAAWATNTRSTYQPTDLITLNPKHPYKGTCDFLTNDEIAALSKIDVNMTNAKFYPDVLDVLLDKFDTLYVFQITPWLMLYAEEFLKNKKPVIFRTSGYPLTAWGSPSNYDKLWQYPDFHVLPTDVNELSTFAGHNVTQVMASIHPDLIDCESKLESCDKFILSVGGASRSAEQEVKTKLKPIVDWVLINKNVKLIPSNEVDKLFNSCYFFFDMTDSLIKYSVLEAIIHGKAVLPLKDKSIHRFMSSIDCGLEYWHTGFDDTTKIKFYVNNPGALDRVYQSQRYWLNGLIEESEEKWDRFVKECL